MPYYGGAGGGGGGGLEARTSDYTADADNAGKLWMRTDEVSATVRGVVESTVASSGSWSAGQSLSGTRTNPASAGTPDDAFVCGGFSGSALSLTEEYNGSTYSSGGNLSTARYAGSALGLGSAGVAFGGVGATSTTEEYDGIAWSSGGNYGSTISGAAGFGLLNSGVGSCGSTGSATSATYEYDGSTWTSSGSATQSRTSLAGGGSQSEGVQSGGLVGSSGVVTSEEYNGSTWTAGNSLGTGRASDSSATNGGQSSWICSHGTTTGTTTNTNIAESYDGTSYTVETAASTAKRACSGFGTYATYISVGGYISAATATCDEWTVTPVSANYEVKTFTLV